MRFGPTQIDQEERRKRSLVTPFTFSVDLGTSSTTIYTGVNDRQFLIRKLSIANTTGGSVALTLVVGGNTVVSSEAIGANTTIAEDGFSGLLIDSGEDLEGNGDATGLRAFGWGLRIEGNAGWVL